MLTPENIMENQNTKHDVKSNMKAQRDQPAALAIAAAEAVAGSSEACCPVSAGCSGVSS
jgi:hypothetical protein